MLCLQLVGEALQGGSCRRSWRWSGALPEQRGPNGRNQMQREPFSTSESQGKIVWRKRSHGVLPRRECRESLTVGCICAKKMNRSLGWRPQEQPSTGRSCSNWSLVWWSSRRLQKFLRLTPSPRWAKIASTSSSSATTNRWGNHTQPVNAFCTQQIFSSYLFIVFFICCFSVTVLFIYFLKFCTVENI